MKIKSPSLNASVWPSDLIKEYLSSSNAKKVSLDPQETAEDNLLPDILTKGGDYKINQIIGSEIVTNNGGKVKILPHIKGYSTTAIINNQGKGLTEEWASN